MSSAKIKKNHQAILTLEAKRAKVVEELLEIRNMVRGAYSCVMTKCGNKKCRCYEGAGHHHSRITWRENGYGFTKKVPLAEIPWTQEMTEQYRHFRTLRSNLLTLEKEAADQLDELADLLIQQTREGKVFLEVTTPVRRNTEGNSPKQGKKMLK